MVRTSASVTAQTFVMTRFSSSPGIGQGYAGTVALEEEWKRATIPGAPEAPRPGALHPRGRAPQNIECTFDARLARIIDPHFANEQEFSRSDGRNEIEDGGRSGA